jgi:phospholipid transport system substrate-binding protein
MQTITRALARGLLALAAALALGSVHAQTQAPDAAAPDVLVKNVTMEVVDLIAKDKDIQAGSRAKLIELIEAKVLPNFNFSAMTALAMGQSWNKTTPEQKKRLVEEFSALAAFAGQKFDFRPLRAKPADTDVTVNVRVIQPGAQPVGIDYSMEKTSNGWKVYDVMVGGVSLVANYRTEFTNVVRDFGVDGLIKNLQTKNHSGAAQPAAEKK